MDIATVSELLSTWGYPVLLLLLLLTGIGSPLPEDLLLLAAGYLMFTGVFGLPATLPIAFAGVVLSDVMLYSAGRHLLHRPNPSSRSPIPARRLKRAAEWLNRIGPPAILIARLVPGTRAITFVSAGAVGMELRDFLKYDILGAIVWVPVALAIGYSLGSQIGRLSEVLQYLNRGAGWVLLGLVLLIVARIVWGREESKL